MATTLILCHGSRHRPKYKRADTMDLDPSTRPTFVRDITSPEFRLNRTYNRVVMHHCPQFLLFSNSNRAFHSIFKHSGDAFARPMLHSMEQVVSRVDEDTSVFDVSVTSTEVIARHNVTAVNPRDIGFFRVEDKYYSNYTILPLKPLRSLKSTWLNLYGILDDDDGLLVIRAPNPRSLALMFGNKGGWTKTLRSLAAHISHQTGCPFAHHSTKPNPRYEGYVTGESALFSMYEDYDWTLKRVSVLSHFTNLEV